jgi:hypothetical protein
MTFKVKFKCMFNGNDKNRRVMDIVQPGWKQGKSVRIIVGCGLVGRGNRVQ